MIKINLLPHVSRKKAAVNRQVQLAGVGAAALVLVLLYAWWYMLSASWKLDEQIKVTQNELKRYEEVAKKVAQFEADKKRLEEKIKIIDRLIASQTGPVRLMDQLSRQLPAEVWLTSLKESGGRVTLQGYAFTDFAIAEYMTRLQRDAGLFSEVELSFSERSEVQKIPVKRFELALRLKA